MFGKSRSKREMAEDSFDYNSWYESTHTEEAAKTKEATENEYKLVGLRISNSTYETLKELVRKGVIKNANNLINDLLEEFIKENTN